MAQEIVSVVTKSTGLNLVGIDVLVEEETGIHYIIDGNYFSSYDGLPKLEVAPAFHRLIMEKLK